jgi:serine protease Do
MSLRSLPNWTARFFRHAVLLTLLGLAAAPCIGPSPAAAAEEILDRDVFRHAAKYRDAFSEVVADANRAIVRVLVDEDPVALGTVVDADGYVLTKASELKGEIAVELRDGETHAARIVGVHTDHDLALLKIDARRLPTIRWATDAAVEVGQWFITPGMDDVPASVGVVSVAVRNLPRERGVLGVSIEDIELGPKVVYIFPGSGAARAGLEVGDVITEVSGETVATSEALSSRIGSFRPGSMLKLVIRRGEDSLTVEARLGSSIQENLLDRQDVQNRMGGRLSSRRAGFPLVIQHDSVLKPDECGGVVVDLNGRAVGVNVARAGRIESYSVPAKVVLEILGDLKSGKFAPPKPAESLVSEDAEDAPADELK